VEVGHFDEGGYISDVFVSGLYAYVVSYNGLIIVDISDPTAPSKVALFDDSRSTNGVFISGSYAYMAGYYGLKIIDLWSPKETISNIILWSMIGILSILAVVDVRYLIKEVKHLWKESKQRRREKQSLGEKIGDPYRMGGERKKAGDFFLGFFLMIGEAIGFGGISFLVVITFWWEIFPWVFALIIIIVDILLISRFFERNRRYIAIGMISAALIPLLTFGGCFLIIGFL
jgi:membrane protein implicated in regulation of membrane protease activity